MAIQLRITFYTLNNGVEINHVNGTTRVNNDQIDQALPKLQDFAEKHHPEAADVDLLINQRNDSVGMWLVAGQSNIDSSMYFVFVITRLE